MKKSIFITLLAIALLFGFSYGSEGGDAAPTKEAYEGKGLDGKAAVKTIENYRESFKGKEGSQQKTKGKNLGKPYIGIGNGLAIDPATKKVYPTSGSVVVDPETKAIHPVVGTVEQKTGGPYIGVGPVVIDPTKGGALPRVGPGVAGPETGELYPAIDAK